MKKTTKKCACLKAPAKAEKCAALKCTKKYNCNRKEVVFTLHAEKGKEVFVAGEFNEWNPTDKKMTYKARQGIYTASMKLKAGTYQYKFVVDGIWCADPENADSVANDQGTFNSVLIVK